MNPCEYHVEVIESITDVVDWVGGSNSHHHLTVRKIHSRLEDPINVDWTEVDRYFNTVGTNGECVMSHAVESMSDSGYLSEEIIGGTETFEYLLVGCSSVMDVDVGQSYTFTLMSFPILRMILKSRDDDTLALDETTMDLPTIYVNIGDVQDNKIDFNSLGCYPSDAVHYAPTLIINGPLGNSISNVCGLYAIPDVIKKRITEETKIHAGFAKL